MRKSVLFLTALLVMSCSDNDQTENQTAKETNCPVCETCQQTECPDKECPSLECNGKECPSCPSCETCPTLECNGKECPTCPECDKLELEAQINDLNADLNKTKEALETQKEELETQIKATESCTGDLDSCTKELAQKSPRNNKSGDRLKLYAYVGADGTQVIDTARFYDTKSKNDCVMADYSIYGCDNLRYCAYEKNQTYNPNEDWGKYYYCSNTYDSKQYEVSVISAFSEEIVPFSNLTLPNPDSYEFYTDSECANVLSSPYARDNNCDFKANSIMSVTISQKSTNAETRICLDSSTYEYTPIESVRKYYTPIDNSNSSFTTIYRKTSKGCEVYDNYKNVVLLRELNNNEMTEITNKAKQKRKEYCQNYCKEIEKIAKEFDWIKFEHKLLEE